MIDDLFESVENHKTADTSAWWNIDGLREEIIKTLPPELAGMKIKWSSLGMRWSQDVWENIKESHPGRIKGINGSPGYSYPPETLDLFLKWLPAYWKEIQKKIADGSEVFIPVLPAVATRTDSVFAGAKICFTGFSKDEKPVLEGLIAQLGIDQKKDVSASIDYLILGATPGPAKIETAIALKKCIVPLQYFVKLIS